MKIVKLVKNEYDLRLLFDKLDPNIIIPYNSSKEYTNIAATDLLKYKKCSVFYGGYSIPTTTLKKLLNEYFRFDKIYAEWDVKEWARIKCEWFDLIVNGKKTDIQINEFGETVYKETKKHAHCIRNLGLIINNKEFYCKSIDYKRIVDNRLIHTQGNYIRAIKDSLPKELAENLLEKYKDEKKKEKT